MTKKGIEAKIIAAGIAGNYDEVANLYCQYANIVSNEISEIITPIDGPIEPAIILALDTMSKFLRSQNPDAAQAADDLMDMCGIVVARVSYDGTDVFINGKKADGPFKVFEGKL